MVQLRTRRLARRRERLLRSATTESAPAGYSVEGAVDFLASRGLDVAQVGEGSIPEPSLQWSATELRARLAGGRPLRVLHVGNFVGVSLGFYTALARDLHPGSVVVSVDPDIRHRGIDHPQEHVLALLGHFGLLANSVVVPGYSLEQNLGDTPAGDATATIVAERACEGVLRSLRTLGSAPFDLAVIDGNHSGRYLERELDELLGLVRVGSVIVVDDVELGVWSEVVDAFAAASVRSGGALREIGRDGRMGLLVCERRRTDRFARSARAQPSRG